MTEQIEKSNEAIALEAIQKYIQKEIQEDDANIWLYSAILKVLTPWKGKKLILAKIAKQLVTELGGPEQAKVVPQRSSWEMRLGIWSKTKFPIGKRVLIASTRPPKEMKNFGFYYMEYDPQVFEQQSGLIEARERNEKRKELLKNDQALLDMIAMVYQAQRLHAQIISITDDYPNRNMLLNILNFHW